VRVVRRGRRRRRAGHVRTRRAERAGRGETATGATDAADEDDGQGTGRLFGTLVVLATAVADPLGAAGATALAGVDGSASRPASAPVSTEAAECRWLITPTTSSTAPTAPSAAYIPVRGFFSTRIFSVGACRASFSGAAESEAVEAKAALRGSIAEPGMSTEMRSPDGRDGSDGTGGTVGGKAKGSAAWIRSTDSAARRLPYGSSARASPATSW
jgi:hypothetical protein